MRILFPLLALLAATPAAAATLTVQVRGAGGAPVAGAVVMVDAGGRKATPASFPGPYVMAQQNIAFVPHVLIVPVGASVSFPNRDKVRHHVYSFSAAKKFELKLYGKDETRSILFDKPGVVALGCNIHDAMNGFVVVVDTPFAAQTDARGQVTLANVPGGAAAVRVWHPAARAPANQVRQPAMVAGASSTATVTLPGL